MFLTRRQLLYLMLGALAVAGASGVLAIFVSGSDLAWRIGGTGLIAAITAAIMMPACAWADKPASRVAGLVGMGVCIAELCLCSVLVWGGIFGNQTWEFAAGVAGALAINGLVAVAFLKPMQKPGWRWASLSGAYGCAVSCAIVVVASFESAYHTGPDSEKLYFTAVGAFWSAVLGSLALVGFQKPDARPWRWAGVAAAGAGWGIVIYGAWIHKGDESVWLVGPYALAAVVAHAIVALRPELTIGQAWVRWLAIITAVATGTLITSCSYADPKWETLDRFTTLWRITAATGIICASASVALLVFGRLNRKPVVELSRTTFDQVTLFCPRCELKQTLPVGGALCRGCRLHIAVDVQSARCAKCNYELVNLHSDRCPECGTLLPKGVTGATETAAQ